MKARLSRLFRVRQLLVMGVIVLTASVLVPILASANSGKSIYFYYGQGCPHCAKVESYFDRIDAAARYPIVKREVYFNKDNAALFNADMDSLGIPPAQRGVPTVIMGQTALIGDSDIIDNFVPDADAYLTGKPIPFGTTTNSSGTTSKSIRSSISSWIIVSAAAVDAINPCAFAVLILLLTTVLAQKQRRRKVIASGLAFSLVVFVSYLMMGLGIYKALSMTGVTSMFTTVVGVLAIILGLFNLKDWLWYGKTPPLEVPMSWRPRMARIIEHVTSPWGAAAAGLLVSLFLLPCTSGPYIVVLGLLASNPLDIQLLWYLVLYNLVFVSPMILITVLVALGTSTDKLAYLRERHIDKLHMLAGLILLGLGVFVLLT